ncbi:hypothetical protein CRG98_018844 [Punica granatum]|uniref:Uncharacterized protein n=1 Tax=Punica granatum TaxID=22663 RepID=A0A2I0JWU0_PUNGR|nr:hypothetical protein CRG98_018844 [Punica granatum]
MAEKVTIMVIKVDLQCDRCYRKIRKVLCSFPVYDEKQNLVTITVVSCCPERILKKICSKGGKSVEKIEMISRDKKKEGGDKAKDGSGEKKKDEQKGKEADPKKKESDKTAAKQPEKKKEGGDKPKEIKEPEKKVAKESMPVPVAGYPSIFPPVYPLQAYYDPYQQHQVYAGGHMSCPCNQCHGMPGYYMAREGNRGNYYGNRVDYFSEENPSFCTVM